VIYNPIGTFILLRWLLRFSEETKPLPKPVASFRRPLLGLPCAGIHSAPPTRGRIEDRELLAWRAWRLATLMSQTPRADLGPRLLSMSAPRIWDGPVATAAQPLVATDPPSGLYTLKPELGAKSRWGFHEDCWVTGTVALSGRVIEHQIGYRAERVVIRELRLAVGTHLRVRALAELKRLIASLETRYQVTVDIGQAEREAADRMLTSDVKLDEWRMGWVSLTPPWQLI
jgi:hypothetical protein